jgi:MFS transporter, PAT family, beta-lactamase induction signal transducer AmpG
MAESPLVLPEDRGAGRTGSLAAKRVASGVLGFASGLPFLLVLSTLAVWLRERGVGLTEIGLMSWASVAYSLKFLIAPFLDAYALGPLGRWIGRRRAWILLSQLGVAGGLVAMSLTDPGLNLGVVAATATAMLSAVQDAAVDGWRIDVAPSEEQGVLAAGYQLGYRLAVLTSGAGALFLAEGFGWSTSYLVMAAIMLGVAALTAFLIPSVERPAPRAEGSVLAAPVRDLVGLVTTVPLAVLAMIGCFRAPDLLAGVMASALYVDAGFSKAEIASVTKIFGVVLTVAGFFLGGYLLKTLSMRTVLIIGILASSATNLFFSALAAAGHSMPMLVAAISFDNVASGIAGTALIAFMSQLAASEFSATRYAVLSSIYALPGHVIGGGSGAVVEAVGFETYFVLTFLSGLPALLLILMMRERPEAPPKAEPSTG